jgi:pentatricopeptide repeat protein
MPCRAGGSLEPDVVAYNTVMHAQAARGHLDGMLQTLSDLNASGLRPTTATYSTLMHAYTKAGATQVVLELWHQMLQSRVLPGTVCLRAYTLTAFRSGDMGHVQDARSHYFGHLLTLPPKQAAWLHGPPERAVASRPVSCRALCNAHAPQWLPGALAAAWPPQ